MLKHRMHYHEFTDSVIHGHHVYKDICTPFAGEILYVKQETHNAKDC